jgi:hypothetical protein
MKQKHSRSCKTDRYGLRVVFDRALYDGIIKEEFVGDYRLTKNIF